MPVNALEKAMTRAIALIRKAMPVKALEKAMTRAIALKKRQALHVKAWKRQ